ncbi:MAG: hypothetical protein CMM61_03475 [Rhodospirillaceae bacterium]|nr:hypothetical protein [Rhodospirillaceae bacterium]|tara:strand:- start:126 stop:446 length:321 start_codon:yes stop_codon:yes gene_type:complete
MPYKLKPDSFFLRPLPCGHPYGNLGVFSASVRPLLLGGITAVNQAMNYRAASGEMIDGRFQLVRLPRLYASLYDAAQGLHFAFRDRRVIAQDPPRAVEFNPFMPAD